MKSLFKLNTKKSSPKQSSPSQFWNQSGVKKSSPKQSSPSPFWNTKPMPKCKFRSGMPVNLFGDRDRDGVPNVFDCKPRNPRKQGWSQQGHIFNRERSTHIKMMAPEKFLRTTMIETKNKGHPIKSQEDYEKEVVRDYDLTKAEIIARWEHGHQKKITPTELKGMLKYVSERKNYMKNLKNVIRQPKGKMEIPYLEYDEQGRPTGHEGRHRAVAAKELGVKLIPVTIAKELKEPRDWKNIRKGMIDGKHYRGMGAKPTKKDWRNDLENIEEITSAKSADIPIKEQRRYGEEQPEALAKLDADGSMINDKVEIEDVEIPEASEDNIEFEDDSSVEFEE